ncbi:hypothetical protein P5673_017370 [Acropora cervicornis]|uniref:Uncharacterized protein n=1 Tax=Acropora cervicornis TaxID=6130 RepID=A0AAD9QF61_ACRCE|nr:hypothetical protein P5673_017370 [Acropora cervicornis]
MACNVCRLCWFCLRRRKCLLIGQICAWVALAENDDYFGQRQSNAQRSGDGVRCRRYLYNKQEQRAPPPLQSIIYGMNRSSFHIFLVSWLHFAPCFQDESLCSYRRKIQFPLAVGKKADSKFPRIFQSIRESDVYRVEILWLKDRTERLVQVSFDNNYQERIITWNTKWKKIKPVEIFVFVLTIAKAETENTS